MCGLEVKKELIYYQLSTLVITFRKKIIMQRKCVKSQSWCSYLLHQDRSPYLLKHAAVGVKGGVPSEYLFREEGAMPLATSGTAIGRMLVLPVLRSTIMGADERGHARQRDGMEEPGCRRACSGVCWRTIRVIFSPLRTSQSVNDLSAADTSIRWPYFDQQTLVIAATHSLSLSSFAIPLVSKSQITQLPSEHPAVKEKWQQV